MNRIQIVVAPSLHQIALWVLNQRAYGLTYSILGDVVKYKIVIETRFYGLQSIHEAVPSIILILVVFRFYGTATDGMADLQS